VKRDGAQLKETVICLPAPTPATIAKNLDAIVIDLQLMSMDLKMGRDRTEDIG